ncbi:MAG: hypothetical protein LRS46_02860 [Desulfurococcales archaeon]|nr:hypothetical protein [Desulfurococcales archaeon]
MKRGNSKRRSIEPVVALIILIAATIAVSIAFVSWLVGFWNIHSTIHGQAIEIFGDSYFDSKSSTLYLHIKTHIDPTATLWFKVDDASIVDIRIVNTTTGSAEIVNGRVVASVGSEFWVALKVSKSIPSGTQVYFKVYTEKGYVYWGWAQSR